MFPRSSTIQVCGALGARRPLGSTGMQVSPVALGTMQFGWTTSEVQSMQILDAYAAAGGNLIDTANMYGGNQSIESFEANKTSVGMSETIIGRWLNTRKCRHKVILTTKVRARMWDGPDGAGLTRSHILRAVDASLQRLCTDHIDILYAHWPDPSAVAEEWLATFGDLIRHGKVGAAGTSNFCGFESFGDLLTPLMRLADSDPRYPRIQVEQPRFNLLHRSEYESALQGIAAKESLGIVTYSSLASGFLTGATPPRHMPAGARAKHLAQYCTENGWRLLEGLQRIAQARDVPMASVSLAWILAQPGISSAIIGPDRIDQLAEASYAPGLTLCPVEIDSLNRLSWKSSKPEFVDW
jgi:aryl-alcohol dehydrogenase-like predicted oxidoreductase